VFKKKRRKGYKVKNGHRQFLTKIQIEAIAESGAKPAAKSAEPKAEKVEAAPKVEKEAAPKKAAAPKKPAAKKEAAPKKATTAKKPAAKKTTKKADDSAKK